MLGNLTEPPDMSFDRKTMPLVEISKSPSDPQGGTKGEDRLVPRSALIHLVGEIIYRKVDLSGLIGVFLNVVCHIPLKSSIVCSSSLITSGLCRLPLAVVGQATAMAMSSNSFRRHVIFKWNARDTILPAQCSLLIVQPHVPYGKVKR